MPQINMIVVSSTQTGTAFAFEEALGQIHIGQARINLTGEEEFPDEFWDGAELVLVARTIPTAERVLAINGQYDDNASEEGVSAVINFGRVELNP